MIQKLLVANRGEIACRILQTAKRMGISTVAVYSQADAQAKHVTLADEAVLIGPADATLSYLNAEAILGAAQQTNADAIHPGYGFLSENPDFVEAVEAAGLIFVGPSAQAIRSMGLKDAAKALMEDAGVPVVPGYHGANQDPATLAAEADRIGYPVLIKARAGGGGKGMRLVQDASEFSAALEAAQREAEAAFGDNACLIEKYITQPRHIEFQVFGDAHGNVVHLFERDCSLQRRHQKVIEEAPAPGMPENVRAAMGLAAVNAARAVGYRNAGTVEFIVDGSAPLREDGFWFIEMNTRLQVEHPVSEAITGIDFVELQLQIASGAPLPFAQEDLEISGWAMEARLYAENPSDGFLPATGAVNYLNFPAGTSFEPGALRIDSGVREGDEITIRYDPMIAKIITHAPTRDLARRKLVEALERTHVAGCGTNTGFLAKLARNEDFANGNVDTGLIERNMADLIAPSTASDIQIAIAAIAASDLAAEQSPWGGFVGWQNWGTAECVAHMVHNEETLERRIRILGNDRFEVNGLEIAARKNGQSLDVVYRGHRQTISIAVTPAELTVFDGAEQYRFRRIDPLEKVAGDNDAKTDGVSAPMPGIVTAILVKPGDPVDAGQDLAILEAMKMEHRLRATAAGRVADVLCTAGDQVDLGAFLIRFEDTE